MFNMHFFGEAHIERALAVSPAMSFMAAGTALMVRRARNPIRFYFLCV
jgi:hypothetical protein